MVWSKAVKSAALEAAGSSIRGGGGAPGGPASSWECRAAQSRQVRPEEAHRASWGTAKEATSLTMLPQHLLESVDGDRAAHRQRDEADHHEEQHREHDAAPLPLLVDLRTVRHLSRAWTNRVA
eukprot:scaffold121271_cov51-Phaeocystis_antarctica.AAC.2